MNKTKIEWAQNPDGSPGYTWNPITGCLNHTSVVYTDTYSGIKQGGSIGLCKGGGFPCYAYRLANGRLKQRYLANGLVAYDYEGGEEGSDTKLKAAFADPFYPRFWEEKLYHPWGGKPKGIFVCDMSDLFGIGIPEEWTKKVLDLAKLHTENRYYLLTKQPQNLIKFSPFSENCWVGVTATNDDMLHKSLIWLQAIEAKVKFISFEPLLTEINVDFYAGEVQWLIIGAQTKPTKFPEISWVREIVEAANKAGVKIFLKNNLRPLLIPEDCRKPNYLTEDIFWASEKAQLRQEMPINSRWHNALSEL